MIMEGSPTDTGSRVSGKAVLIKKGQIIPENAVPIMDNDIIQIQENRIAKHKPQSDMRVFTWGQGTIGASVALASLFINQNIRQNFKLGGLRRMATYVPVVVVPTCASLLIHEFGIKRRVLLGREECPLCISLRSGIYQLASGVLYPYVIAILAATPIARENYTLPLPVQKSGSGLVSYLRVLRTVSPPAAMLLGWGLFNVMVGMKMASTEMRVYATHLRRPPTEADIPLGMKYGKR